MNSSSTSIDTERLRALLAASTPGPWAMAPWHQETILPKRWIEGDNDETPLEDRGPFGSLYASSPANAALVAEALTALPVLLDEVDRLRFAAGELLTAAFILRDNPGEDWAKERFRGGAAGMASLLPNPDAAPARGELPRTEGEG